MLLVGCGKMAAMAGSHWASAGAGKSHEQLPPLFAEVHEDRTVAQHLIEKLRGQLQDLSVDHEQQMRATSLPERLMLDGGCQIEHCQQK